MKKRRYLWHVFILLNAPIRMRRDVVRELSELLSDKMEQGRTIEEAIMEIGSAREIAEVYKEMDAGRNQRYQVRMIVCIVIAVLLGVMLYFDGSELAERYSGALSMSNSESMYAHVIGTGGIGIKLLTELVGVILCIANGIRYGVKQRKIIHKEYQKSMKENGYLFRVFFLIHVPLKQKREYLRILGNSLDEKLEEGKTMEEAIAMIGSPREVAKAYNDMGRLDGDRYRARMWIWMSFMVLIGILLAADMYEWVRGYSIVSVRLAPNRIAGSFHDVEENEMIIKIAVESIGFIVSVFCAVKCMWKKFKEKG